MVVRECARAGRILEELAQEMNLAREGVDPKSFGACLQRARRQLVGPRSATDAEVDASRRQGFEHPKLLGDFERAVVGEHHAARTDPEILRLLGYSADQDLRARTGERVRVVMLGQPVAV